MRLSVDDGLFLQNTRPPAGPWFFVGLDLGQSADFTALAVLEHIAVGRPDASPRRDDQVFHARHLYRYPLGTSYPAIVADVGALLTRLVDSPLDGGLGGRAELAVDATGVGRPVVDMFRRRGTVQAITAHGPIAPPPAGPIPPSVRLHAVTITGGNEVTRSPSGLGAPKRDLIGIAQRLLQEQRLKIAPDLAEAATLVRELQQFKVKISEQTAHDSYGAWRDGEHDDLVLAVALAAWVAQRTPSGGVQAL